VAKKKAKEQPQVLGFLGVGLDNSDGHKRLTRGEHFFLIGGSAETHGHMQDTALRFGEKLRARGKRLEETSVEEALDLFRDSLE
jgi:hypothetical protein